MAKILAESLKEFRGNKTPINEEEINESSKGKLLKFMKNPEKYGEKFKGAFAEQVKKFAALGAAIDALEIEAKKKLAKEAIDFVTANPGMDKLQLPLYQTKQGQVMIDTVGKYGKVSGKGVAARSGVHGGTTTKG